MNFQAVLKEQAKRVLLAPRKLLVALCILVFLLYCLLGGGDYASTVSSSFCVANHWGKNRRGVSDDGTHWTHDSSVAFVGNGHIGIDVAKEREVRIAGAQARLLDMRSGFKPLVNVRFTEGDASSEELLTDYDQGVIRVARCVSLVSFCVFLFVGALCATLHTTPSNILLYTATQ
uniref:Transmembrane protein n=1 Tax=Steinernema glaseri TaxID=37863 RepID=A0A1I8AWG0_9BILA